MTTSAQPILKSKAYWSYCLGIEKISINSLKTPEEHATYRALFDACQKGENIAEIIDRRKEEYSHSPETEASVAAARKFGFTPHVNCWWQNGGVYDCPYASGESDYHYFAATTKFLLPK